MVKKIPLTQGKVTLVDDQDYEWLSQWKWQAYKSDSTRTHYARRSFDVDDSGGRKAIRIHRLILGVTDPRQQVDHINGDGLDNHRNNLRAVTQQQNSMNAQPRQGKSSVFKGVTRRSQGGKWRARIGIDGKRVALGDFDSEKDAAKAYNEAALKYFGEFARLNDV